jgi:ceramide glucosyltransferase
LPLAVIALLASCIYCLLALTAALGRKCRRAAPERCGPAPGISILKPLSGLDEGLEANLRSFFEQNYGRFEILFAVRNALDPAAQVARRLMDEYAHVDARLIVTGEPPYPHAKVFSLRCMLRDAKYGLVAMSDSDVRVGNDFCQALATDFSDPELGLVTCPYRAVGGADLWSRLEAAGMNTDFHAGVFTALMLEGATFAVGVTIAARRRLIDAIGGIERVKDFIGWEDFMLGRIASEEGFKVAFSSYVVEHRIGTQTARANLAHRLRWARTNRCSRPVAYVGQIFVHTLPIAAFSCAAVHALWPLGALAVVLRAACGWTVSSALLGASVPWLLIPAQDFLALAFWFAGFFGSSIEWRGQCYELNRNGTVRLTS